MRETSASNSADFEQEHRDRRLRGPRKEEAAAWVGWANAEKGRTHLDGIGRKAAELVKTGGGGLGKT